MEDEVSMFEGVYLECVARLLEVEEGKVHDKEEIRKLQEYIMGQIEDYPSISLYEIFAWGTSCLRIQSLSMLFPNGVDEGLLKLEQVMWKSIKTGLLQQKALINLKKKFQHAILAEDYSNLTFMYSIFYFLVLARCARLYYIMDMQEILENARSGIQYIPKDMIDSPFMYDEMIEECMLELKQS